MTPKLKLEFASCFDDGVSDAIEQARKTVGERANELNQEFDPERTSTRKDSATLPSPLEEKQISSSRALE